MKLLVFLLLIFSTCCSNSGVLAFDELELDYNDNFQYIPEYQSQARFLNVSFDDIFNNSLLTLGGIFVIGVILFEVALYALDVYYNNTYANTNRWDTKNGNSFTNSDLNCPSCPYYDPYQQTYRNNKQESSLLYNIAKIPQWITLAYEIYETSNGLFNDMDCQKKAICEVYQNAQQLGAVSQRARHSLDNLETLSLLSLPDEFMNIIDEFVDAQEYGKSEKLRCQDLFYCPKSLLELREQYLNL